MTNDFYCEQVLNGKTEVKKVATDVVSEHGACRVITNLGQYQDSKYLHWHVVYGSRK